MQPTENDLFNKSAYAVSTLADEIRVDAQCDLLLKACYLHLVERHELGPEETSRLCYGASYFLREYLIPDRQANLFEITPRQIRQFAGNWYIVRNMEPNLAELSTILEGVLAFYTYCRDLDLIAPQQLEQVQAACCELDYYRSRIDSFHAIENDGFFPWDAECPLRD